MFAILILFKMHGEGNSSFCSRWIYDIKDGLLQDLDVCISNSNNLEKARDAATSKIFTEK